MAKAIIKELIILLLLLIVVILLFGILFYEDIPSNKLVPEKVQYQASEEVQTELQEDTKEELDLFEYTYEVNASDLKNYQKTNEYNPGKVNPFAAASEKTEENSSNSNTGTTNGNSNTNNTSSGNGSNSSSSSSGSSSTYYPDKGTK